MAQSNLYIKLSQVNNQNPLFMHNQPWSVQYITWSNYNVVKNNIITHCIRIHKIIYDQQLFS